MKSGNELPSYDYTLFRSRMKKLKGESTQIEFAKKLGIDEKTYRNWVNGCTKNGVFSYINPSLDNLISISEKLNVSIDYLLGRAENISDENAVISQALALDDDAIENFKAVASHIRKYDAKDKHRTKIFNVKEGDEMLEAYNAFFSSPLLKSFLSEVSTFLSNFGYKYPVHYYYPDNNHDDETIPDCKIDDTIMDYSSNGTPLIHLAKEKDSPRYNASFQVNDRFVENLVLIEIQRVLVQMKNDRGDAK